jgi:hypothetical protein
MPTQYYTSNAALQYNVTNDLTDYLLNDTGVTGKKFLTEAPLTKVLPENELSALYFLCNDGNFIASAQYTYYDAEGGLLAQTNNALYPSLTLYHNAIPVNWVGADPAAVKMRVRIIRTAGGVSITEERFYIRDTNVYCNEKQVNWLNKLGGYDSFMFTAGQETAINVRRENPIEFSMATNFESPNRINGYRSHSSIESLSLATRVDTKETADWLKRELIDSIDVYVVNDLTYVPVNVKNSSVVYDTWSKDFIVKFQFEYAFPINIQTR